MRRAAAGAILRKIPFSHPIPADSAENQGRHDSAGCGNTIFSVTAPGCLNVRFLHCNYFTRRTSVIYTRRSFRPFHHCTAVIAWKPNQQLSHFLPSISKTYTICLTDQVRKSNFLQNRTIRDNRNRLIGIFFHFRTLETVFQVRNRQLGQIPHLLHTVYRNIIYNPPSRPLKSPDRIQSSQPGDRQCLDRAPRPDDRQCLDRAPRPGDRQCHDRALRPGRPSMS